MMTLCVSVLQWRLAKWKRTDAEHSSPLTWRETLLRTRETVTPFCPSLWDGEQPIIINRQHNKSGARRVMTHFFMPRKQWKDKMKPVLLKKMYIIYNDCHGIKPSDGITWFHVIIVHSTAGPYRIIHDICPDNSSSRWEHFIITIYLHDDAFPYMP